MKLSNKQSIALSAAGLTFFGIMSSTVFGWVVVGTAMAFVLSIENKQDKKSKEAEKEITLGKFK